MGISNFGMPHWFVLTLLLLFHSCEGFHFNVTRVIHGDRRDLFTNMDPLGKCPRRNDTGRQWCLDRNGDCSNLGCCICSCTYSHSTFRMGASPKTATCVENSSFRTFAGKGFAIFTLRAVVSQAGCYGSVASGLEKPLLAGYAIFCFRLYFRQ